MRTNAVCILGRQYGADYISVMPTNVYSPKTIIIRRTAMSPRR